MHILDLYNVLYYSIKLNVFYLIDIFKGCFKSNWRFAKRMITRDV